MTLSRYEGCLLSAYHVWNCLLKWGPEGVSGSFPKLSPVRMIKKLVGWILYGVTSDGIRLISNGLGNYFKHIYILNHVADFVKTSFLRDTFFSSFGEGCISSMYGRIRWQVTFPMLNNSHPSFCLQCSQQFWYSCSMVRLAQKTLVAHK